MKRHREVPMWALLSIAGCAEEVVDASGEAGTECSIIEDADAPVCAEGLVCETGTTPGSPSGICAEPVVIRGIVTDGQTGGPIAGALVSALDATGTPVTRIAMTDATGAYSLTVPTPRTADGALVEGVYWTLFVSARDYQAFPAALRPAIPVYSSEAAYDPEAGDGGYGLHVVDQVSTRVALLLLPEARRGGRTISGRIGAAGEDVAGTLVVAEPGPDASYTIADAAGEYTLFNVPPDATITGYRRGVDVMPIVSSGTTDAIVDLPPGQGGLATVLGSVNLVNAPGGAQTSVVLIPVSVFSEALERGPVPYGLRDPQPPQVPSISGAFTLQDVPVGRYKVLAALENDGLVRDPDTGVAGTELLEIEVIGADVNIGESFKVTAALGVVAPGADVPEPVSGAPTFVFEDDSSEDFYTLVVHDAFGEVVWEVPDVPRVTGSANVSVPYAGPPLQVGMYYQYRATSMRGAAGEATPISRTEDVRGVFIAQ